jgi:hypothetical protein
VAALIVIIALLLVVAVVVLVSAPLRRAREVSVRDAAEMAERDELRALREELEARREAKYREIRDAELDYRTGKLSREDHEAIDASLRSEALQILDDLERHEAGGATPRDA